VNITPSPSLPLGNDPGTHRIGTWVDTPEVGPPERGTLEGGPLEGGPPERGPLEGGPPRGRLDFL